MTDVKIDDVMHLRGKVSHKKWRAIVKRQKRKAKRKLLAQAEGKDVDTALSDDAEKSADEQARYEEEKRRERDHQLWLERERRAQAEWRSKLEWQAKEKKRKEEEEKRIKEEWEEQQRKEKDAQERREKEQDEKKKKQEALLNEATKNQKDPSEGDWHNPIAPTLIPGIERDQCPFFLRVGACRFGERCSRAHVLVDSSRTLLFPGMYTHIELDQGLRDDMDADVGLEYEEGETYSAYVDFYEDVFPEFRSCGRIVQFKTCCNYEPHLRGNVYVQYEKEEDAMNAYLKFNGRFFGGRQLTSQFTHVTDWKKAICGLFFRKRCPKGKNCNFLHVFRNPGNAFWQFETEPERQSTRESSRSMRRDRSRSRDRSRRSHRRRDRSESPRHSRARSHRSTRSSRSTTHRSRSRSRSPSRKSRLSVRSPSPKHRSSSRSPKRKHRSQSRSPNRRQRSRAENRRPRSSSRSPHRRSLSPLPQQKSPQYPHKTIISPLQESSSPEPNSADDCVLLSDKLETTSSQTNFERNENEENIKENSTIRPVLKQQLSKESKFPANDHHSHKDLNRAHLNDAIRDKAPAVNRQRSPSLEWRSMSSDSDTEICQSRSRRKRSRSRSKSRKRSKKKKKKSSRHHKKTPILEHLYHDNVADLDNTSDKGNSGLNSEKGAVSQGINESSKNNNSESGDDIGNISDVRDPNTKETNDAEKAGIGQEIRHFHEEGKEIHELNANMNRNSSCYVINTTNNTSFSSDKLRTNDSDTNKSLKSSSQINSNSGIFSENVAYQILDNTSAHTQPGDKCSRDEKISGEVKKTDKIAEALSAIDEYCMETISNQPTTS